MHRLLTPLALLLPLTILAPVAFAQTGPAQTGPAQTGLAQSDPRPEINCTQAVAQMELTWCAEQDWVAADARLNEAYPAARDVMRRIDSDLPEEQMGAEAQLLAGQRAWITFRDATCAAEGYIYHGGSMEPMVIYACRARLTETRAEDLERMAEPM